MATETTTHAGSQLRVGTHSTGSIHGLSRFRGPGGRLRRTRGGHAGLLARGGVGSDRGSGRWTRGAARGQRRGCLHRHRRRRPIRARLRAEHRRRIGPGGHHRDHRGRDAGHGHQHVPRGRLGLRGDGPGLRGRAAAVAQQPLRHVTVPEYGADQRARSRASRGTSTIPRTWMPAARRRSTQPSSIGSGRA